MKMERRRENIYEFRVKGTESLSYELHERSQPVIFGESFAVFYSAW